MSFNYVSMKKWLSYAAMVAISVTAFTACSSDSEDTPAEETKTVDITDFKFSVDANMPTKAGADGEETRFEFDGGFDRYKFTVGDEILVEDSHGNAAAFIATDVSGTLEFQFLSGRNNFETNGDGKLDLKTVYPRRETSNMSSYSCSVFSATQIHDDNNNNNYSGLKNSNGFHFYGHQQIDPNVNNPNLQLKPNFVVLKLNVRIPEGVNATDVRNIVGRSFGGTQFTTTSFYPASEVINYNNDWFYTFLNGEISESQLLPNRIISAYYVTTPYSGTIRDFRIVIWDVQYPNVYNAEALLGDINVNWEAGKYYESTVLNTTQIWRAR